MKKHLRLAALLATTILVLSSCSTQIGFIAGHTNLFTTLPGHSEIADPVGGGTCR